MPTTLTTAQQDAALAIVAQWLGTAMGYDAPAPTGPDAANTGQGPMLNREWDWPNSPTPTVLLEGGPDAWAINVSHDETVRAQMREHGVYAEPWSGWALCLYPE